ncbi:glycosyl transferase [Dictyobacter sp. S3.2.2.5]|uniref:Glycosyl transferase n=1 Tax=Dictyobacter halimunensis TaxID=3026934 RepID=A0ABQ6FIF6_9CHLR|nr:glycosyl transferase [Dictyobacter sp. S3.2.2.5]
MSPQANWNTEKSFNGKSDAWIEHTFDSRPQTTRRTETFSGERIADVRKIAVLRTNRLGDFIFILPALEALRAAYPQAELVLLTLPWTAAFLSQRPSPVDRAIVVPLCDGVSVEPGEKTDQEQINSFLQTMQQEGFDLACQFRGGGRFSNPFVKKLGARVTIGSKAEDAIPLDRWIPYHVLQSEYIRYLEVVALAGTQTCNIEPHVVVTEQDRVEARSVLPEDSRPLAILHPGAIDPGRRWPSENFARVGDVLAKQNVHIVLTGTHDEQETVDRVQEAMHVESSNLCGRLSLGGLAALLARSRVVVSNDTGPLHLAHAVGARTVGIYWCLNAITAPPLSRLRHVPLVSWQANCPVCGCDRSREQCDHSVSLVSSVSTDEVITAAQGLLSL